MKITVALRNISLIALLGAALAAPVFAQPGPGGRAMRFDQNNTRGWTLMTPEDYERVMEIVNKLDAEMFDLTVREYMESGRAHGRWVQNRNRDGSYAPGGHWRR